jgi:hypothetical protein
MSKEQTRALIYDQLCTIADTVIDLPLNSSKKRTYEIIQDLYEVMRQLSDYSES